MIPQFPDVEVCVLEQCPSWELHKIMQNEIMSLGHLWDCKLTGKMQAPSIGWQYSLVGEPDSSKQWNGCRGGWTQLWKQQQTFYLSQCNFKVRYGIGVYLGSSFGHKIHKRNPEIAFFNNPDL